MRHLSDGMREIIPELIGLFDCCLVIVDAGLTVGREEAAIAVNISLVSIGSTDAAAPGCSLTPFDPESLKLNLGKCTKSLSYPTGARNQPTLERESRIDAPFSEIGVHDCFDRSSVIDSYLR